MARKARVHYPGALYHVTRGLAAWLVMEYGIGTLGELSKRTGRDITTLSSAAKRLQMRFKTDLELAEKVKKLLDTFS